MGWLKNSLIGGVIGAIIGFIIYEILTLTFLSSSNPEIQSMVNLNNFLLSSWGFALLGLIIGVILGSIVNLFKKKEAKQ